MLQAEKLFRLKGFLHDVDEPFRLKFSRFLNFFVLLMMSMSSSLGRLGILYALRRILITSLTTAFSFGWLSARYFRAACMVFQSWPTLLSARTALTPSTEGSHSLRLIKSLLSH